MSTGIFEKVKEFLFKLVKDENLREELHNTACKERPKVWQNLGYSFSKQEFEIATLNLLEQQEKGELTEISDQELAVLVGGFVPQRLLQPLYGVSTDPY